MNNKDDPSQLSNKEETGAKNKEVDLNENKKLEEVRIGMKGSEEEKKIQSESEMQDKNQSPPKSILKENDEKEEKKKKKKVSRRNLKFKTKLEEVHEVENWGEHNRSEPEKESNCSCCEIF